jgi:hypothetical protein
MISILVRLTFVFLILCAQGALAGERLVCAISYKGADYTAAKTEILAVDPETGERHIVFSDEKAPIVLVERLYVFHFPVVGGGRLFAHAAERGKTVPFPGNASLYELSIDGSNTCRKICPVLGVESLGDIFVNSTGTRIGYINRMNGKQYVFIHDVANGTLLSQVDITDKFLDCYASSIGWVPRKEMLYFSLETGDADLTSEASYARVGTYFMDERGQHLKRLPAIPAVGGFSPPQTARMIGVLPAGGFVFETTHSPQPSADGSNQYRLVVSKIDKNLSHADNISFSRASGLYPGTRIAYQLSPSGRYMSAARVPVPSSGTSASVLLKNLDTNEERTILSISTEGFQGPFLGLVGWLD